MDNYQPNSHKFRQEQKEKPVERKKVQKVVGGTAKVKQKSELRKFTDVFISEDASNVKSYILMDVLVPGVKKLIVNMLKDTVEMVFGETGRSRDSRGNGVSYVSYDRFSNRRDDRRESSRSHTRFDYGTITFENRGDAEAVLDKMDDVIATYGFVTIADMYDMADLSAPPYTSTKYGWTNLRNAEVVRTRDGDYIIKLPSATPI